MVVDRSCISCAVLYGSVFLAGALSASILFQVARIQEVDNKRKRRRMRKKHGDVASAKPATSSSTAGSDGLQAVNMRHVNQFLRWDCTPPLLAIGLFPNAQEISESMACLHAIDKHLDVRFSDTEVLCIVVGDGVVPRTGTLFAMRTKWKRIVSVDPAMFESLVAEHGTRKQVYARGDATSSQSLERRRSQIKHLEQVERLEMLALEVEKAVLSVEASTRHVVFVLPHAHVVPDFTLGSLRLESEIISASAPPVISLVQLPCCKYEKHNTLCGISPDVEYLDNGICSGSHGKRMIRVWKNVSSEAILLRAVRLGDRPPLSHKIGRRQARDYKPSEMTAKQLSKAAYQTQD